MQALLSVSTEGGVGSVLGASLCMYKYAHICQITTQAVKIREIHCNTVAGVSGVLKVAQDGPTLQWWNSLDTDAHTDVSKTLEQEI